MATRIHKPIRILPTMVPRASRRLRSTVGRAAKRHDFAVDVYAIVVTRRPWLASWVATRMRWQTQAPAKVIVCTEVSDYDAGPIEDVVGSDRVRLVVDNKKRNLGQLRNLAMHVGAQTANDATLMCTVDDDDWYGPDYFAGIAEGWRRFPTSWIIGRCLWDRATVDSPPSSAPVPPKPGRGAHVRGVTGATISVPFSAWREGARYPGIPIGEDVEFQQRARSHGIVDAPFGHYVTLRYNDPRHRHASP